MDALSHLQSSLITGYATEFDLVSAIYVYGGAAKPGLEHGAVSNSWMMLDHSFSAHVDEEIRLLMHSIFCN